MSSTSTDIDPEQEILRIARQFSQQNPDWVVFFREILGVDGAASKLFPNDQAMTRFQRSENYGLIQVMIADLRGRQNKSIVESNKVITVRLPTSLHESLSHEAYGSRTSVNQLCITKLLQPVSEDLIPGSNFRYGSSNNAFRRTNTKQATSRSQVPSPTAVS